MRLFLSSQDLGLHAARALRLAGANTKMALVVNAADHELPEARAEKVGRKIELFAAAGFDVAELDLRDYFGKPQQLDAWLQDYGVVWCNGGNTFTLRRAMRASGLDELLLKRLDADTIMYGGSSAGSCICAPSLRGIDNEDRPDPDNVPAGYSPEIIWDGLDLVPYMIVPHHDKEWFREGVDTTVKALSNLKLPFITLNDGEVVIVDGGEPEVMQPQHALTRYRPISQKPYCCVPTSLQMVLDKNHVPRPSQEEIGAALGLVVPTEFADMFENVTVRETPVVGSGFGTRIQDPEYSLEALLTAKKWPLRYEPRLASRITSEAELKELLAAIEARDGDALLCYQNDKGFGHVVVFDRLVEGGVRIVDPSPLYEKWRVLTVSDMYDRIQKHGDANVGGVWLLERA